MPIKSDLNFTKSEPKFHHKLIRKPVDPVRSCPSKLPLGVVRSQLERSQSVVKRFLRRLPCEELIACGVRAMEKSWPTRIALRQFRYYRSHRDLNRPRVLCVGYQKTGTTSFALAMRELGFSHYGYDQDLERALQKGDLERCLRFAKRFDSLDDQPWSDARFIEAFKERHPGSYYVLLERDDPSWLRSYRIYYGARENEATLLGRLHRHNEKVLHLLADEPHLLRMNICAGDGYERLCPFLGLPHPGVPFPWANRGRLPSPQAQGVEGG